MQFRAGLARRSDVVLTQIAVRRSRQPTRKPEVWMHQPGAQLSTVGKQIPPRRSGRSRRPRPPIVHLWARLVLATLRDARVRVARSILYGLLRHLPQRWRDYLDTAARMRALSSGDHKNTRAGWLLCKPQKVNGAPQAGRARWKRSASAGHCRRTGPGTLGEW